MTSPLRDPDQLRDISPAGLSAYARFHGWEKAEEFGENADVYVHPSHHDLVLPRHTRLLDYARVVANTIGDLAKLEDTDELTVFRRLKSADRDEIRVRGVPPHERSEPSISEAAALLRGARSLILDAACQAESSRAVLRPEANKEAVAFADRIRMEHTEPGSFVLVFRTAVVPTPLQPPLWADLIPPDEPGDRRFTACLPTALSAASNAAELAAGGDSEAFDRAVDEGVSANLLEALADLMGPFPEIEVDVEWALTAPRPTQLDEIGFDQSEVPIFREAAATFRSTEPRPDEILAGMVELLARPTGEDDGRVRLRTFVDKKPVTVSAELKQSDYELAVQSHGNRVPISLEGDLERVGQRWRLLGAELVAVHGGE